MNREKRMKRSKKENEKHVVWTTFNLTKNFTKNYITQDKKKRIKDSSTINETKTKNIM